MADSENSVSERMRADWNQRAREDAHYYVAFGGRDQDEEGFDATAADVLPCLEFELKRFSKSGNRRSWRALEIGCGPGRLMKPLSRYFGEIHGVDVSDEMIRIAAFRTRTYMPPTAPVSPNLRTTPSNSFIRTRFSSTSPAGT